ncbi:MAG: hypothetical protein JKY13_01950 [Gammaproteobacteria bacterium]|nr:hypothetical protein [Gammaproteobacteria bacterium]
MLIDFWFNLPEYKSDCYLIAKENSWSLKLTDKGSDQRQLTFLFYYNGSGHSLSCPTDVSVQPCTDNQWHSVRVVVNCSPNGSKFDLSIALYLNGTRFDKSTTATCSGTSSTKDVLLCKYTSSSNYYQGYYSGLSMVLSDQLISQYSVVAPYHYSCPPKLTLCINPNQLSSTVVPINNRPNYVCYGTKDDTFLIKPDMDLIGDINDHRKVTVNGGFLQIALDNLTLDKSHHNGYGKDKKYTFTRLSTSVVNELQGKLQMGGAKRLLSLDSQKADELNFSRYQPSSKLVTKPIHNKLNFDGAYGNYFWELFFYVPFLIANQLNSNYKFDLSKQWYERCGGLWRNW